MKLDLDKLWQLADETLQRHESEKDEYEEEEQYHDGWIDAMRWLMDTLEPTLYGRDEADDEW